MGARRNQQRTRALHTSGDIYMRCYGRVEQGVDALVCRRALDLTDGLNTLAFLAAVGLFAYAACRLSRLHSSD